MALSAVQSYYTSFKQFIIGADFYKGLIMAFCIAAPLGLGYLLSWGTLGISVAIGVLLSSPADVPGNFRHKVIGIISAGFLGGLVSLIMGLIHGNMWLSIPVMGVLVFGIAYLSVYGFRASLVSVGGLLAIVLSFARPLSGMELVIHSSLIFVGGIWYTAMSVGLAVLLPVRHTEELLAKCILLTSRYLRVRGEIAMEPEKRNDLYLQLLELQTSINESHETLRDILINARTQSGHSNLSKRYLLTFIELVDIMELAVASPYDSEKVDRIFHKQTDYIDPIIEITFELSRQLEHIASAVSLNTTISLENNLKSLQNQGRESILRYSVNSTGPNKSKGLLLLKNWLDYQEKQIQKVVAIQRILKNLSEKHQLRPSDKNDRKFITQVDYSPKLLVESFSLQSPIFRHSLRLSITMLVGFAVGNIFQIQNAYWILMTIIVIMRPSYGLTRERSKQRIIGTLIGASIAAGVVLITQNETVYGVLALISLILAFSFIQKNYRAAATFITLNIVFLYALLQPNAFNVIQYRVLDTATGAVLAIIANAFLLPAWEFVNIRAFIKSAISSNREYLVEIDKYYHQTGSVSLNYKLSRKHAFLAIGNLNAAFQRMAQEPKSKQRHISIIYELVALNSSFLSALAGMGTFMQNHKTTGASEYFEVMVKQISHKLEDATAYLSNESSSGKHSRKAFEDASEALEAKFNTMINDGNGASSNEVDSSLNTVLQEARLISDQLNWLYNIADNMCRVSHNYQLQLDED